MSHYKEPPRARDMLLPVAADRQTERESISGQGALTSFRPVRFIQVNGARPRPVK